MTEKFCKDCRWREGVFSLGMEVYSVCAHERFGRDLVTGKMATRDPKKEREGECGEHAKYFEPALKASWLQNFARIWL